MAERISSYLVIWSYNFIHGSENTSFSVIDEMEKIAYFLIRIVNFF